MCREIDSATDFTSLDFLQNSWYVRSDIAIFILQWHFVQEEHVKIILYSQLQFVVQINLVAGEPGLTSQ